MEHGNPRGRASNPVALNCKILTFEDITVRESFITAIEKSGPKVVRIHIVKDEVGDSFDAKMDYTAAIMIWKAAQ